LQQYQKFYWKIKKEQKRNTVSFPFSKQDIFRQEPDHLKTGLLHPY